MNRDGGHFVSAFDRMAIEGFDICHHVVELILTGIDLAFTDGKVHERII
jgi:hypothetical protein